MKPVVIYTTNYCTFCVKAKELFRSKGVRFEEIDVTSDDEKRQTLVDRTGGLRTVPQIFIGETHVGGFSDLSLLEKQGKLDALLQ